MIHGEFGDDIVYIVSGLKSWLETGEPLAAPTDPQPEPRRSAERACPDGAVSFGTTSEDWPPAGAPNPGFPPTCVSAGIHAANEVRLERHLLVAPKQPARE